MTSTRMSFETEAQQADRPCTPWDDMVLPTVHSWSDLEGNEDDNGLTEAQQADRPYTSWDDMVLPTVYSWSDLEEDKDDNGLEVEPSHEYSSGQNGAECAIDEEMNERQLVDAPVRHLRDCRIDPDDDWSDYEADDESDNECDDGYESDDTEIWAEKHHLDWPSYHQD
ncbi:hypothetical protein NXS19_005892 [Fusarium pseudograminearum]|nr:hypothetical protein FPSE5266_05547 [Fusarium pseudograminearum]UZP38076.1 hypothetical protein NXS19_005892 [Fusarium pseudograminearum]